MNLVKNCLCSRGSMLNFTNLVHYQARYMALFKFKAWRRAKIVLPLDVPDYDEMRRQAVMTHEEKRQEALRRPMEGYVPNPTSHLAYSCSSGIRNEFIPPEGDGKASLLSKNRVKDTGSLVKDKTQSLRAVRRLKRFDKNFKRAAFAQQAHDIYVEAHQLLQDYNEDNEEVQERLHELVTERAYPEMVWKLDRKTFRWKFIESIEPPRVMHIEVFDEIQSENYFAQITVRLHTKQTLALYDRFGRLMFGGEELIKNCLEYIVFERHLSDEYGMWRIHGKIIPKWHVSSTTLEKTFRRPEVRREDEELVERVARREQELDGEEATGGDGVKDKETAAAAAAVVTQS